MLGGAAPSPWDSEIEPSVSPDECGEGSGDAEPALLTGRETWDWKQSLEMPSGSGDEPWSARKWKGEVEKALIRRGMSAEQILGD